MSENKEKKKGFWASLFTPKPSCGCSCGAGLFEEVPDDEEKQSESGQPDSGKESCCGR